MSGKVFRSANQCWSVVEFGREGTKVLALHFFGQDLLDRQDVGGLGIL